jgi:hypothetical protein
MLKVRKRHVDFLKGYVESFRLSLNPCIAGRWVNIHFLRLGQRQARHVKEEKEYDVCLL